ncbi:23S rRNA (pseudouridine(1915)-N(3))-methyltransferase RlmH [Selenomonadales bacterium OttesenSCG-928-I06]|nr:23S rRNA (pseudouridine(1915)-N(3))-methyltransferase RlmH [Selenomonadales bacterium OttesenSCG-928-I06]
MKISIISIGKIKESYLTEAINEYLKRLTPYCKINITEILEEKINDNPSEKDKQNVILKEGEKILSKTDDKSYIIALDVKGVNISSEELAEKIDTLKLAGQSHLTFIIGGPFGLSNKVKEKASFKLSFSKMTFTHQMIRLFLLEQIYRAFKISKNEKYHW